MNKITEEQRGFLLMQWYKILGSFKEKHLITDKQLKSLTEAQRGFLFMQLHKILGSLTDMSTVTNNLQLSRKMA